MKKFSFIFIMLICCSPQFTISQNNYFIRDSVMTLNASLVDNNRNTNQRTCRIRQGNELIEYSPWQVSEYGFKDGRVFISMNLPLPDSVQRVFAERLVRGKSTIYYYKNKKIKTFFLDTDSTEIKELPKKRSPEGEDIFRDDLIFYTSDCPQLKSAISLVAYDREAYKKLFHRYQTCKIRPFPFFKYGIIVGYSAYKPIPAISISTTDFRELEYSYDGGFTGGVFMDYPIMLSDISLYAELAYTQHTFSANAMIRWDDTDFYGKISTLQFPVMVRYAYPFNKIRPYAGFGGIFTYNFNIENKLYKATIFNNTIEINDIQVTNVIKEFMVGFTLGGGLSVQILPRNWIFVEARYNRHYTLNTSEALDFSEYQVVTGFTF